LKKVLNVGGNSKAIPLPAIYAGYEHHLLDIDPAGQPDLLCDARELSSLAPGQYDAVYCSHNLEHYFRHDVPKVLAGFRHVLKEDGFAHVVVPDIGEVMRRVVTQGIDVEDILYQSHLGPITVLDVLYGYGRQIEASGKDFFAHKTGFTERSLQNALLAAGFTHIHIGTGNLDVVALAFKAPPRPGVIPGL